MNRPEFFKRKSIRIAVAVLMTAASFWVMLRLILISKEQLINIPASFQIAPLLLTLPLFLVTTLLTSFIWGQMMSIFDNRISISQHIIIYLATLFAGRLPGGIWNVVGRIAWYDQLGIRKRITTFVSILQWFMIIWSGTIVLLLVVPWIIGFSVKNCYDPGWVDPFDRIVVKSKSGPAGFEKNNERCRSSGNKIS